MSKVHDSVNDNSKLTSPFRHCFSFTTFNVHLQYMARRVSVLLLPLLHKYIVRGNCSDILDHIAVFVKERYRANIIEMGLRSSSIVCISV